MAELDQDNTNHVAPPPYFGFGIAGLGTGLVVQGPLLLLLVYMTDTLAIPAALAGLAMFGPRIFDIITDPIMGIISDRTHSRWGRRRPYLLIGGIVVAISMGFLFSSPFFDSMYARLFYVMLFFIIVQTGVTIFMVPYYAMPSEMTDNNYERTKLMSTRAFFSLSGVLIGGVLAPWIVFTSGGGQMGYRTMSIVIALICGGAFIASFFGTKRARFVTKPEPSITIKEQMNTLMSNKPFVIFTTIMILYITGMGCFSAAIPYFARYILERPEVVSTIWFYIQVPAIIGIPLWTIVTKRIDKKVCYIAALIMMATSSMLLITASPEIISHIVWSLCVLFGLGFGGTQVVGWSMLPDIIPWDRWKSGTERGGIFSGGLTAGEKIGFALGTLVAGTILQYFDYAESAGEQIIQSETAIFGINTAVNIAPPLFFLLAAIIMFFYPLTHKVLNQCK